MPTPYQLRGYVLEEALAWLLRHSGYEPINNPDRNLDGSAALGLSGAGLVVCGRGADHQVDVLGEFGFTPPFSLPIRMFVEAKYLRRRSPVGLHGVRNAWATIVDINENQSRTLGRPLRRYHVGNLLREPAGRVVLCDFDATCLGPWQVDLVAVAVGQTRFGRARAHAALAGAYGYDVTTDADWPLLREARELKMVAAAVPLLASAPGVADEFHTRLRSVIVGNIHAR